MLKHRFDEPHIIAILIQPERVKNQLPLRLIPMRA